MKLVQSLLFAFVALLASVSESFSQEKRFSDLVGNVAVNDVQETSTIRAPYIFWGADVATFYANGNTKTQNGSIYNKLGLNVELTPGDDFVQQVRDYMSGKSPFLRGTMGMIGDASEVANSDPRTKPVVIFQLSWSKGDHLVVKSGIKTVADLRGKTLVLQEGGPHPKLLDDILKAAGLTWNDIKVVYTRDLTGTDDSPASLFKRRQDIDGAFVVTPDMIGLTGGMQQRLAIAQVMINKPRLTIMDEPFSALDEANKERQQRLLLSLRAENEAFKAKGEEPPYTFMIVTHEINEAIYVGDRVIGLSQHWNWQDEGHSSCPGAKIVYDKPAPVFSPYDVVHYGNFVEQKSDILKTVFNKDNVRESWQEKVEKAKV